MALYAMYDGHAGNAHGFINSYSTGQYKHDTGGKSPSIHLSQRKHQVASPFHLIFMIFGN